MHSRRELRGLPLGRHQCPHAACCTRACAQASGPSGTGCCSTTTSGTSDTHWFAWCNGGGSHRINDHQARWRIAVAIADRNHIAHTQKARSPPRQRPQRSSDATQKKVSPDLFTGDQSSQIQLYLIPIDTGSEDRTYHTCAQQTQLDISTVIFEPHHEYDDSSAYSFELGFTHHCG